MSTLGRQQWAILGMMADNWELGLDRIKGGKFWLQKGGLGKGGEAKHDLSEASCSGLRRQGYIRAKDMGFPTQRYELTDLGKQIVALGVAKAKGATK